MFEATNQNDMEFVARLVQWSIKDLMHNWKLRDVLLQKKPHQRAAVALQYKLRLSGLEYVLTTENFTIPDDWEVWKEWKEGLDEFDQVVNAATLAGSET